VRVCLCLYPTLTPPAEALGRKTFRGLEMRVGETEVVLAVQGTTGTSMGYSHEVGYKSPA
jgi:hypothetical protein